MREKWGMDKGDPRSCLSSLAPNMQQWTRHVYSLPLAVVTKEQGGS